MGRKDYAAILAGLKKVKEEIKTLRLNASKLNTEADAAEGVLRDDVAKKNIDGMREISTAIFKATTEAMDYIIQLERKIEIERDEFESLR